MRWMVLLVGCYAPAAPSGAYRCSTADSACPVGQHCVCSLCVNHDQDAACGFAVDATQAGSGVAEHQSFAVEISALQKGGDPAGGFNDTVTLSFVLPDGSPWCDVKPATVKLDKGKATAMVTLNRETIPPQKPKLRAVFAGNQGESAGIQVVAPAFTKDAAAVVPPVGAARSFGWSETFVAEPAILHDATGYRMYFIGYSLRAGARTSIGLATSTDGRSFTAQPQPVWGPADGSWYSGSVQGPAPFFTQKGISLGFTGTEMTADLTPKGQIGVATSSDGISFTVGNGGQPSIHRDTPMHMADCDYCSDGIDFATVLDDPGNPGSGTGPAGKLMFFSGSSTARTAAIGRASSSDDGKTWTPEPAPVLQGDIGGEAILIAPHVLLDGSVFKMWYSFARLQDVLNSTADLCGTPVHVGYATSSDGFYWVRSPSNSKSPAIAKTDNGWDAGVNALVAGSAVPLDGNDPANGIALYYTTLRHVVENDPGSLCVANGIGRSTRM
jgi:hypothetical protein